MKPQNSRISSSKHDCSSTFNSTPRRSLEHSLVARTRIEGHHDLAARGARGQLDFSARPSRHNPVPLKISGFVNLQSGSAAADYLVTLEPYPPSYERRLAELLTGVDPQPPQSLVTETRTGEDGRLDVTAPTPGPYRVHVVSPEGATIRAGLMPLLVSTRLPKLIFPTVTPARVRVVDSEGTPIAGALVIIGGDLPRHDPHGRPTHGWRIVARVAATRTAGLRSRSWRPTS